MNNLQRNLAGNPGAPGNGRRIPHNANGPRVPQNAAGRRVPNARRQLQNVVAAGMAQHHDTAIYLRGRDTIYPDAAALARFNAWVIAHQATLDPAEQFVCNVCGHVDFILCAHRVAVPAAPAPAAQAIVVPAELRHHAFQFRPMAALRSFFSLPSYDTHSPSDSKLFGFNNGQITDQLIIDGLFSYCVLHQQTNYLVNGVDDRALRLAHTHRLAERWLIGQKLESLAETDLHYCARVRFTVQRACDNMQNDMLYQQRTPAKNFWLAWLPRNFSPYKLCLAYALFVVLTLSILVYWGGIVSPPGWGVSAQESQHPHGNTPPFLCVSTNNSIRLVDDGGAYNVIQYCNFTDWVMALYNEGLYQFSGLCTWITVASQTVHAEICLDLQFRKTAQDLFELLPTMVQDVTLKDLGFFGRLWHQVTRPLVYYLHLWFRC